MICNQKAVIWHKNGDTYVRMYYPDVYVRGIEKIDKNGIKQKGYFSQAEYNVRIPSDENVDVCPGDYMQFDDEMRDEPDRTKDFRVTRVADNRRGANPHYRIFCER